MLEAIYSSKMFLASKNKDKVTTAINDPLNGELVQQLRSYLDDDFLEESKVHRAEQQVEEEPAMEETSDNAGPGNGDEKESPSGSRPHGGSGASHSTLNDMNNLSDAGVPDANDEMTFDDMVDDSDSSDSEEVEESVTVSKKRVNGSTTPDLVSILNSSDLTKGVRRINSSSDSELWIYYNDDVNLNNVMENVISSVSTCCPNVEFSRLARTYNAVVFSI